MGNRLREYGDAGARGQKDSEKCTAAFDLQPPILKSDRLLDSSRLQNQNMALDLSSLTASIGALQRALHASVAGAQWAGLSPEVREAVKAGVIQNFEVAYEQSWKMMRRWLEANPVAGDVSGAGMRQVYRLAAKAGMIDDVDLWMEFHQARHQTSHTCNVKTAELVLAMSKQFLPEAQRVLGALEARND